MKNLNSALEFDARMLSALNVPSYKNIYDALIANRMQVVDSIIYSAKVAGAVTSFSDLFKPDDVIKIGKSNLNMAVMPANTAFLVTGIALQYSLAAGTTDANLLGSDFGPIPNAMRYGEITLTAEGRLILDKLNCEVFHGADNAVATGDTNAAAGTAVTYTMERTAVGIYKLEKPKWIFPNERLAVDLRFAEALASANSCVKILLFGAKNCSI